MVQIVPENPDTLLTREQAAAALTASGFPVRPKTLSTRASRGGGPAYRLFGARVLYRWGDLRDWAVSRLTDRHCSTSERGSVRALKDALEMQGSELRAPTPKTGR